MNWTLSQMFKEFRISWKSYLLQSFFAALSVFFVLSFLSLQRTVIIASIGATAFIVFAMPKSVAAKPRSIIGGNLAGILTGSLCCLIPHDNYLWSVLAYSLSVGMATLVMVIIDTEHPPAAAISLGVTISGFSIDILIVVLASSIVLSIVHYFFKPYLKDLA